MTGAYERIVRSGRAILYFSITRTAGRFPQAQGWTLNRAGRKDSDRHVGVLRLFFRSSKKIGRGRKIARPGRVALGFA